MTTPKRKPSVRIPVPARDCIPFSFRKCEPYYYVPGYGWLTVAEWYTRRRVTEERRAA